MAHAYPGDLVVHLESFAGLLAHVRRGGRGAFERAARDLRVDRSVLRRRIQALGEWIGRPLLDGRGTELHPTAAGARLAERAERIVAAVAELRAEVLGASERLVVACTGTVTTELLPSVILQLEKQRAPIQIVVRRAGGEACEAMVRNGDADVGVVRGDAAPRGLLSRHLADDRLWFVLPARHPLAARPKLTLAAMASVPLVLFGDSSRTRARVMDRLARHGASIRVEVDGRATAVEYVRAGIGATFLSLLPAHTVEARGVSAHDVTSLFGPSRFFVIRRHDRGADAAVTDVIDRMCRAARR
jgi:DNA-binding transcriptional LysR family regulator